MDPIEKNLQALASAHMAAQAVSTADNDNPILELAHYVDVFLEQTGLDGIVPVINSLKFFETIERIIIDKMIVYATMDIIGIAGARRAFDLARNQLHTWRNIYEGCMFTNGYLTSIGESL